MKTTLILLLLLAAPAQSADYTDPRMKGIDNIERYSNGVIKRSQTPLRAFRAIYPCPVTGNKLGSCPGWALDHVIPLAVGGRDILSNIQWLPLVIKAGTNETCSKDRWERIVYNGEVVDKYTFPGCYK